MKALIYIMGKSASGKDTIYKKLIKATKYKGITIYTTRPKRENEEDGKDYFFVDENYLNAHKNKIIEKRVYYTKFGAWIYATLDDGQFNDDNIVVAIGTLESYISCKQYFGNKLILPIYIHVDDELRLKRALIREGEFPDKKKIDEVKRRFEADAKDFSNEKLKQAGINEMYENIDIDDCLLKIEDNLRRELERI